MSDTSQAQKPKPVPWWGWVIIVVGSLAVIPFISSGDDSEVRPETSEGATTQVDEPEPQPDPEPEPEPIEFEWPAVDSVELAGNGDDVVLLEKPLEVFAAMRIDANSSSRYFGVKPVYLDGESGSSLVNTTDPFLGTVLLEGNRSNALGGFEVRATGDWTLTLTSISEVPLLESGETFLGSGGDLLRVKETGGLTTLDAVGNAEGRYFGLKPYGARSSSLINTTDPYDGTVRVPSGTVLFEVTATGDWALTLN